MTQLFPSPSIKPFERLQASDGLLINAERWRRAHEYHRLRQGMHFQALNQPGIVCGLGVQAIPAPADVRVEFRDGRWVRIQPGIAIDLIGNPIVVPQPIDFRIAVELSDQEPLMVYLVVKYVDPDELRRDERRDIVQETFRVDEKSSPPEDLEVEVCRVLLQPGPVQLENPRDVFFPGYNAVDLRFRLHAQPRPQAVVNMALVNHPDPEFTRNFFNLSYLLKATGVLYPALQGAEEVGQVTLEPDDEEVEAEAYDLLYLTGRQPLVLNSREFEALKNYLDRGGVLLVDAPLDATPLIESVMALAQQFETPLEYLERLRRDHPLRTQPFLFAALPMINQQPLRLLTGGGIILVVGDLASAWGIDENFALSRLAIRTAQELGINILTYAWRRRQLFGLQQQAVAFGGR
ncbi:DUF4159 domain-containing protein [Gloeobacter kilaueensis]|uniref:DUF4159 domain-containing protein n=1 Tax=Gloeobacter kilaueensis (strain ATCC BAA-2537 / CCAP 1431/1 / ULC 316 / JS1) TaxID=1183438 RepID=U5QN16_GLOK1|nr:DUF4159 domain-containing protein [Gloeobacter kilaueensis]AGY58994.1 hypothetical protein GKIL_2748 [Gloeobacter kilaueensis JS1]